MERPDPAPSETWRFMQFIEANRHRADLLDAKAATGSPSYRTLLLAIAEQRREMGDQLNALAFGRAPNALTRLLPD